MKKPLWIPSEERINRAKVTQFIKKVNAEYGLNIDSYSALHKWSVENIGNFWESVWDFVEMQCSCGYKKTFDDLKKYPGINWFLGSELNFAENLLRFRDEQRAVISVFENNRASEMSYSQLYGCVASLAKPLIDLGLQPGDRVVGYMPNVIETVVGMLSSTSAGAIWSSVGTELGVKAVVDRISQIEPKVMITVDGYSYKGSYFDLLPNVTRIVSSIPSLEKIIVVKNGNRETSIANIPNSVFYNDFLSKEKEVNFKQLEFNSPVFIMFSSGTTGKPKCMVQSAGGVLINHLKELVLHTDLCRKDKLMYITTPSWMMWNWSVSSLAVGATLVLYDGNPNYPDWKTMWQLIEKEQITVFGCSASYINYLKSLNAEPGKDFDLSSLREISQTGSALSAEGFEYVYKAIKKDLHFNSISGGTDINGCFAAGTPIQSVYAGELQGPALGMKVKAYSTDGHSVVDQKGELVCEAPAPSMPLYFWKDEDNRKYREAYFSTYPGVWRHGDWIVIDSETGGMTFLGRSDFTLKPSGVRIGPAEIYNIVEKVKEIADSIVIGQNWGGDQRIILFVKIAPTFQLTEDLKGKIKKMLRQQASPRHVPFLIIEVPEIPYTCNMKKVESAVTNIMNGKPVTNKEALFNPESLDFYDKTYQKMSMQQNPP